MAFNIHAFSQVSPWDSQIEDIYGQMRVENRINQIKAKKTKSFDLKILTINLGLLNIPLVAVPYYNDRADLLSPIMEDFIVHKRPGILFIQELWHKSDFDTLNEIALSLNYIPIISYKYGKVSKRGLQILIDRKIVQDEYVDGGFWQYMETEGPVRAWFEELFGHERGLLYANITLSNGKKILLGNTHLTPGIHEDITRKKQLQSLIRYLKSNKDTFDYILLGGDFNFSPDLKRDEEDIDKWYDNQSLYIYFDTEMKKNGLHLLDTYKTVRDDMGFTQNRKNPITAMGISTKYEPEQRLDFLWAGTVQKDSDKNLAIIYSYLIFNQPISSKKDTRGKNIEIYLSDHFGVMSTISLFNEEDQ